MIKFFANNNSFVVILIPVFVILHLLLDHYFPSFNMSTVGQENLWNLDFSVMDNLLSSVLAVIFISVNAILLNFVFNSLSFYDKFIYLPSLTYVFMLFLFPISLRFGEDLVGHLFFILSFYQLLSIQQNEDARNNAFLSALFLGAAATFLPIYSVFFVIIWFGLFTIRPFVFREYVLPIFGFLFPFLWVVLVNPFFLNEMFSFSSYLSHTNVGDFVIYVGYLIVVVLALLANKKILERRIKSSIRYKRIISVSFVSLLFAASVSTLILIFRETYFYFTIILVILPFILPYAFLNIKRAWIPNALFYALIVLNVVKFFY
ncbi:hypothetical protein [Brumimicrobium oceani]|uniref:Beta-carotene 15,15'-monooxygenase n=1 Tax=Brumimicrobium oceani TaxID=2100725 RepID=A0A2U2XCP5_9FLAO|nr:hypothetical protein [Brumimicrobium oceani]PWH85565.1 hypothetical protein DIT68_07960 [Brumimicrobium oceani]